MNSRRQLNKDEGSVLALRAFLLLSFKQTNESQVRMAGVCKRGSTVKFDFVVQRLDGCCNVLVALMRLQHRSLREKQSCSAGEDCHSVRQSQTRTGSMTAGLNIHLRQSFLVSIEPVSMLLAP